MYRYKLTIEYDGTNYSGWQRQADKSSIQDAVEIAINKFSQEKVNIYGSGRTDAGVHAREQIAHCDFLKEHTPATIIKATNFYLRPQPISILACEKVDSSFHARFSAAKRYYQYQIINRLSHLAIDANRAWHIIDKLDVNKLKLAVKLLENTHDFSSFRTSICQAASPIKKVDYIKVEQVNDRIYFEIAAQSFLHNMVRNIVGTVCMVGRGKWTMNDLQKYRDKKDSKTAKFTAPACGLYLLKIDY